MAAVGDGGGDNAWYTSWMMCGLEVPVVSAS